MRPRVSASRSRARSSLASRMAPTTSAPLCAGSRRTSSSAASTLRVATARYARSCEETIRAPRRAHAARRCRRAPSTWSRPSGSRRAWSDSYLFIQGPPGSGKTYTGAHLILHLIEQGHRVGVASGSHAAIHNLLAEVEKYAPPGEPFAGLKKCGDDGSNRYESKRGLIGNSKEIADFAGGGYDLVAGTAWLFCREEMDGTLDYLFIDEAGQISLADALAMGTCARNVILLGDPQQLAQVSQAVHPPGAGVSVLEHLLGEHTTIPPERGLFIDQTRRMHPDVCRFISKAIYEDRLESFADCANQRIDAPGRLTGTGVRYVPVAHEGNTRASPEEAETIDGLIEDLLEGAVHASRTEPAAPSTPRRSWSSPRTTRRCAACARHLPDGVRVGTVDKFQGQEAAVCFFSMATSSGEEIPRNLEFLFSRNRLNVAISRARCLAVLVCNPSSCTSAAGMPSRCGCSTRFACLWRWRGKPTVQFGISRSIQNEPPMR